MKKINSIFILILSMLVLLQIWGCDKPRPLGSDYNIHVLASDELWEQVEPIARQTFERIEYTPQTEKLFTIIKAESERDNRYKNLLFISTLDATDVLSKRIAQNLSEAALQKVKEGEIMFTKSEVWAQDQKVMFLVAEDVPSLIEGMKENEENLFLQFEEHWRDFHREILYALNKDTQIEKHLLTNYGFMLKVPVDYKMEVQSAGDRFVMFHRKVPLRWISVFWEEATDANLVTEEHCIARRNEFAETFYEGEVVADKFVPVETKVVNFNNRRALYFKGLWENNEKLAGGPFRMYAFFDEAAERIYYIDMHMFAPDLKKSKMHYLRQMDIIANTFKTNLEIKPEDL